MVDDVVEDRDDRRDDGTVADIGPARLTHERGALYDSVEARLREVMASTKARLNSARRIVDSKPRGRAAVDAAAELHDAEKEAEALRRAHDAIVTMRESEKVAFSEAEDSTERLRPMAANATRLANLMGRAASYNVRVRCETRPAPKALLSVAAMIGVSEVPGLLLPSVVVHVVRQHRREGERRSMNSIRAGGTAMPGTTKKMTEAQSSMAVGEWSLAKFESRYARMKDCEARLEVDPSFRIVGTGPAVDPFSDDATIELIGTAHLWLTPLRLGLTTTDEVAEVAAPDGSNGGGVKVHVKVSIADPATGNPLRPYGGPPPLTSTSAQTRRRRASGSGSRVGGGTLRPSERIDLAVDVIALLGVDPARFIDVYARFKLPWEATFRETGRGMPTQPLGTVQLAHRRHVVVQPMTAAVLDTLEKIPLVVEVWGTRVSSGSMPRGAGSGIAKGGSGRGTSVGGGAGEQVTREYAEYLKTELLSLRHENTRLKSAHHKLRSEHEVALRRNKILQTNVQKLQERARGDSMDIESLKMRLIHATRELRSLKQAPQSRRDLNNHQPQAPKRQVAKMSRRAKPLPDKDEHANTSSDGKIPVVYSSSASQAASQGIAASNARSHRRRVVVLPSDLVKQKD